MIQGLNRCWLLVLLIILSNPVNAQAILNPDNKLCVLARNEALKDYASSASSKAISNAKSNGLMEGSPSTEMRYAEQFLDSAAKHSLFYLAFCKN